MLYIGYFIVFACVLNLIRMTMYLIASDLHVILLAVKSHQKNKSTKRPAYTPRFTVLVPAHNEAACIEKTLQSLHATRYPHSKMDIIVINDGSTDETAKTVAAFIKNTKHHKTFNTRLINQKNKGKAAALNNALKRYAKGTLVMCLDADSLVEPDTIKKMAVYFVDKKVKAVSSNVNIVEDGTLLGLAQRIEYLLCYRMKRAETLFNVEYIIGGIGSVFRRMDIAKAGYYDTNTMTEDIDLSMKLINHKGNSEFKFIHAPDAITYTQPVANLSSLIRQRYRWKYGRWQTFMKNTQMFFSQDKRYAKQLTWFMLPFALFQELMFLFEPVIVGVILYASIVYGEVSTLWSAVTVISVYIIMNVWASDHLAIKERLRLSLYSPAMYFLLYMLSLAEYAALIKGIFNAHKLRASIFEKHITWKSPERSLNFK